MEKVYQLCEYCGECIDDYRPMNNKLFKSKEDAFKSSVIYQDERVVPFVYGDYILGFMKNHETDEVYPYLECTIEDIEEYVVMCDALYKQKVIELELY